ncbi:MAG: hypothetical protein M3063_05455 [Actinomycetota bacterium]|nr:hypothetical protein [Actinomycetota bacterium]
MSTVELNFPRSVVLKEIDVHPGDVVQAGQVLARSDDSVLQAKLVADQAVVASDQLALSEAAQAVGQSPATMGAAVGRAKAMVATDTATTTADQAALAETVVTAPSPGVVASVGGTVGDVDAQDGVRHFLPVQPPTVGAQSGINLFPGAPVAPTQSPSPYTALITVHSAAMRVIAQVAESDLSRATVGRRARITVPALPGRTFDALVDAIEPTAFNRSGHVYYLLDLKLVTSTDSRGHAVSYTDSGSSPLRAGLSVDVTLGH